jgi:hypothetical protein
VQLRMRGGLQSRSARAPPLHLGAFDGTDVQKLAKRYLESFKAMVEILEVRFFSPFLSLRLRHLADSSPSSSDLYTSRTPFLRPLSFSLSSSRRLLFLFFPFPLHSNAPSPNLPTGLEHEQSSSWKGIQSIETILHPASSHLLILSPSLPSTPNILPYSSISRIPVIFAHTQAVLFVISPIHVSHENEEYKSGFLRKSCEGAKSFSAFYSSCSQRTLPRASSRQPERLRSNWSQRSAYERTAFSSVVHRGERLFVQNLRLLKLHLLHLALEHFPVKSEERSATERRSKGKIRRTSAPTSP